MSVTMATAGTWAISWSRTSKSSSAIGKEFCEISLVRKLTFSGSTEVGRILLKQAADQVMKCSMELAQKEGIFVGITAGGTFAAALKVAAQAPKGSTILCMLPDTGERYLSTPLFADVPADMTEEEMAISASTPSARSRA